jgi:hypothetical protein
MMTPEELQAWIESLPGRTFQQKLNLAQDLADAYNIDLFGANTQFVPEMYVPDLDTVSRTWGSDPVFGAIFTAIDNGMSPAQAVQAARQSPELKDYFPATGGGLYENALTVAGDYAAERLQNQFAQQQFELEQANKQAIFEGKQPLGLPGESASMYDVLGQPSLDELTKMYAESIRQPLGTTDLSVAPFGGIQQPTAGGAAGGGNSFGVGPGGINFRLNIPRPGMPDIPELTPSNVARGVVGAVGGFVPRTVAALGPSVMRGIRGMFGDNEPQSRTVDVNDRTGGESAASIRARQEYVKSRTGAAQAAKKVASSSIMANNPQFRKFVEDRAREMAYRSIAGMAATPVMSPRDQQAAARLAALQRFSNAG